MLKSSLHKKKEVDEQLAQQLAQQLAPSSLSTITR
jgi:hypothetical protein